MQHARRPAVAAVAALAAAAFLTGACATGFGLARGGNVQSPTIAGDTTTQPIPPETSPAGVSPESGVPAPASDPAAVPGAGQFGVAATDDFCAAAPKVATAFVGLFNSVYAGQGPELQAQLDSALVAVDVLRTVAPDDVAADLETSRSFLARFRDLLAASGWNLQAAAQSHPEFFGGGEPDTGFAAMTAVTQAINARCGADY